MGLRDSLEQIKALTEIPFAHTAGDHELIYQIATEALAQHPAAVVELTDGECWSLVQRFGFNERRATSRHADVRKGFCLSGAFLHYEVQPYELARFARAVIAAHIAKQGGAA